MTAWTYLTLAICLEIAGTLCLKLSNGFADWRWGVTAMVLYALCFWALAPALRDLPVGLAYALWAGLGIVGASVMGLILFGDRLSVMQLGFIAMILTGAIGLRLSGQA